MPPTELTVAVTTFKRGGPLAECLASLAAQRDVPHQWRVVVVDNDPQGSGRPVVDAAAAALGVPVTYLIESRPGIAHARNAAVRHAGAGPLLAFIDDDERADERWLAELLSALDEHDADVVQGKVRTELQPGGPGWVDPSVFHREVAPEGQVLRTAITGNVLVALDRLDGSIEFDTRLALVGGEDTKLFGQLASAGARIVSAPRAVVTEEVPLQRQRVRWVLRRAVRAGSVWAQVERDLGGRPLRRTRRGASALVHVTSGSLGVLAGVVHRDATRCVIGLRDASLGLGMLMGLAGLAINEYQR